MDQRTLRSTSSMGTPSSATASPNPNKSLLGRLTHSPNSSQLSSKTRAILAKLDELDTPARQVRRMPVLRRPAVERWVNPSPAKQSKREGAADRSLFALPVRRMTSANSSTPDSPVFSASTFNLTAPVLPLPQSSRSLDAPPLRRAADLVPSRLEILQQTLGTSTIRAKPYWRDLTRTPKQANPSLLPNGGGASSVEASQASISFVNGNTSFNASKLCSLFDMDMGVKSVQRKTALPPPTRKIHQKPMKGVEPTQKKPTNVFSARFSEEDEDSNQGYDQEAYKKEMLSIKPLSEGTAAVDDRFKNLAFSFLKPRQNSAMEVLRTEAAMETQQHSSDESDDAEVEIVESRQNNDSREVNESVEEKQSEEGSEGCSSDESGDESDAEKDKHKRDKQETSVSPITPADSSSTGVEASPISSKSVSPASPPTQSIQTQPPAAIVSSTSDVPLVKQTNGDSTGLIGANANKEAAWDCEACFVSNNSDKENCVCCGASKPGPKKSAAAGASDDKPWDCQDCFVQNKADQSKCGCCGASKPGSSSSAPSQPAAPAPQRTLVSNIATFGASKQTSGSYSFGFSSGSTGTGASSAMPAATTASAPVGANSAESVTSSTTTTAPLFGIGTGTGTSSTAPIFGSGFGSKPAAVTTTAATSNQVAPPIFGFGLSAPAVSKPSETSTSSAPAVSSANPAAPIQSLFGSGSSSGIFGSGLLGKPSGTAAPTTTASSFAASAPAPFTFGQPQLGTAGNKETVVTTTASATAPFTFGAKPAESTSSSAAPTITFGSLQPGTATAAASPFGSLTTSLSQTKPAPTATTSGPAASSPFTFGAKPAGKVYTDLLNGVYFRKVRTTKNVKSKYQ
ncbi:hypothetical protein WR25_06824 [Diploscapter pachys]|uniref:RanBP2-type domain-containing protein n=1 Tax=Diploscapter pachys TaxID=2018661 RepID=A0A2A2JXV3_9BILA|nr:hypothetical protein WR25_06824 [Diploscapter pachys]